MTGDTGSVAGRDPMELIDRLRAWDLVVHLDYPLAGHTTYGVGGRARCAVVLSDEREIERAAEVLSGAPGVECLVVGRGSNLLVADAGYDGIALIIAPPAATDDMVCLEGDLVVATGSTPMPVLARRSAALGRAGLEWAVGIPGTVGGAVRMNAGGHGSDMEASVVDVELLSCRSGRRARVDATRLGFHFRGSALAPHHVVVRARFASTTASPEAVLATINSIVAWRREHQPGGRNAGSVFVNPRDGEVAAGALIDDCGLRGRRSGGAHVSTKHANFIQVDDDATAADIVTLMSSVQDEVLRVHGVRLRSEVRLVGFSRDVLDRFADPRHATPRHAGAAEQLAGMLGEGPAGSTGDVS